MTQVIDPTVPAAPAETDLVAEVQRVLAGSPEPLTLSKIRARLPGAHRQKSLEELADSLRRQVTANVLYSYPRYRSQQERFWDRPMSVHIATLLRTALEDGPLAWPELRRKLPAYTQTQAESVLREQVAQGLLYRHPRTGGRGGDRFGTRPADPKDYLRLEMPAVFTRLQQLGFGRVQVREAALDLLHEEEWDAEPASSSSLVPSQMNTQPASGLKDVPG